MLTNVFLVWTPFIHSLNKYLLKVYFVPKSRQKLEIKQRMNPFL